MLKALLWAWSSGFQAVSVDVHLFMSTTKAGLMLTDKEKKMTVNRTDAPLLSQQPFCCFYGDVPLPGCVSGSTGLFLSSPNLLECNNSSEWKNVLNTILYSDRYIIWKNGDFSSEIVQYCSLLPDFPLPMHSLQLYTHVFIQVEENKSMKSLCQAFVEHLIFCRKKQRFRIYMIWSRLYNIQYRNTSLVLL